MGFGMLQNGLILGSADHMSDLTISLVYHVVHPIPVRMAQMAVVAGIVDRQDFTGLVQLGQNPPLLVSIQVPFLIEPARPGSGFLGI